MVLRIKDAAPFDITELKPGVFRIRVTLGRDESGERIRKSKRVFGTRRDAEREARNWSADEAVKPSASTLAGVQAERITFGAYVQHVLDQRVALHEIGENAARSYRSNLKNYLNGTPLAGVRLRDVNASMIAAHMAQLPARLAVRTKNQVRTLMGMALQYAVDKDVLPVNPVLKVKRISVRNIDVVEHQRTKALTEDQAKVLMAEAAKHPLGHLLLLTLLTGMRRNEVCALQWKHIVFGDGVAGHGSILIRQALVEASTGQVFQRKRGGGATREEQGREWVLKGPKSKAGVRDLPMSAATARMLQRLRAEAAEAAMLRGVPLADTFVFQNAEGGHRSPHAVSQQFSLIAAKAGLGEFVMHDLRHTWVTHAIRRTGNWKLVSKQAGHSDVTITMGIYNHLLEGDTDTVLEPVGVPLAMLN